MVLALSLFRAGGVGGGGGGGWVKWDVFVNSKGKMGCFHFKFWFATEEDGFLGSTW